MRRRNKSAAYGYYGGVSNENHYVPNASESFIPQPPLAQFTVLDQQRLEELLPVAQFVAENAPRMVLRIPVVQSSEENVDTFVLATSGNPNNVIVYSSNKDRVVLDDVAGDGIKSNSKESIDGGFF
jgi:hypothetical protein